MSLPLNQNSLLKYVGIVPDNLKNKSINDLSLVQYQISKLGESTAIDSQDYVSAANILNNIAAGYTVSNLCFPLYIPPPSTGTGTGTSAAEKIIPGIICHDDQHLGQGQPAALRLYELSGQTINIHDYNVKALKNNVIMEIDSSKNVLVRCTESFAEKGLSIWTLIFNIFDASGWALEAQTDVSLNITNLSGPVHLSESTIYDISLAGIIDPHFRLSVMDASGENIVGISNEYVGSGISSDASYSIYVDPSNNELKIKCSEDASHKTESDDFYVSSLKFNLFDTSNSNTFLGPDNVYLHLSAASGLDISYNHTSTDVSFVINPNPNFTSPDMFSKNNLIKLDPSGATIGRLLPYAYKIIPNQEYYNINTLTYRPDNLITLDTSGVVLGQLNFA